MTFESNLLYLGMKEMSFKDGRKMFSVEFYAQQEGSIKINLWEDSPILPHLKSCSFGQALRCSFRLRPVEKGYHLSLLSVVKDGKAA